MISLCIQKHTESEIENIFEKRFDLKFARLLSSCALVQDLICGAL